MLLIAKKRNKLEFEGSYKVAMQEYVEAILYYQYVFYNIYVMDHGHGHGHARPWP